MSEEPKKSFREQMIEDERRRHEMDLERVRIADDRADARQELAETRADERNARSISAQAEHWQKWCERIDKNTAAMERLAAAVEKLAERP